MDFVWKNSDACVNVLLGGMLLIQAVADYVRYKRMAYVRVLFCLSVGAAFTAIGLLALQGLIRQIWNEVFFNAFVGAYCLVGGIAGISGVAMARRTRWLFATLGALLLLMAVFRGLYALDLP